ncbi:hypothetical protein ACQEVB_30925 [Pseudonocardia sp. CA-107938]|uniref:hypothetical protein n=1 Tax=Pseudonocardia sp. CA-107938 TaxID=3240021 RepID=UPI003D90D06B
MTLTERVGAAVVAMLVLAACGSAPEQASVPAVRVDLPAGSDGEVLAVTDGSVLVGVRRDRRPGLLRRAPDGTVSELPATPSTGYGATASWYALTADGDRVLGIGGDNGGAHGNVRWSVWTGTTGTGVAEHTQAFSTFGGWGAGDLMGAVFTAAGPVLIGSWMGAAAGTDIAVWTATGDEWNRRSSAGTALASTRTTVNFAQAATRAPDGVLVVGWQAGTGGQAPVVWRGDGQQWTATPLPDGGKFGVALTATCAAADCVVAGRSDGQLALWRTVGGRWSRVAGLPPIPVGERDPLAAPLVAGERIVQIAADGDRVVAVDVTPSGSTVRPLAIPAGPVRGAAAAGPDAYVLVGAPAGLWQVPGLLDG